MFNVYVIFFPDPLSFLLHFGQLGYHHLFDKSKLTIDAQQVNLLS